MKWLRNEWYCFCTALMFFTRIPIPFYLPYNETLMNKSQKYYPWVGLWIGVLNAIVLFVGQHLFGLVPALVVMMCFSVLLTGAFHEDGFVDVCDSFGGGYGKNRILTIMKDSRVGAYGAIGIVLLFMLKLASLYEINILNAPIYLILIFAHTCSRFISGTTVYTYAYVQDIDVSKSKPIASGSLPTWTLAVGTTAIILPFLFSQQYIFLVLFLPAYISKIGLARYFKRHIGGYTGDCLGAIQQVSEVVIYLSAVCLMKYT